MIYVFLADGFEEIEAITPIDILRRAELEVVTVAVGTPNLTVTGSHGITVIADIMQEKVSADQLEMVILPGGMPGTLNLKSSNIVRSVLEHCRQYGVYIGAICAAPSVLGCWNMLDGVTATCFDGFEKDLIGAQYSPLHVCCDQKIVTARGAGVAVEFAFKLAELLCGTEKTNFIRKSMQCQ